MRVYGDENVAPNLGLQKTIHHRNKSSPALSTLAHGGLKAAAKRTAFGDLGNAANIVKPSKDDMAIPGKGFAAVLEKSIAVLPQERKSTALLRPAQRPLSVSGLKSLLHNVSGTGSQAPIKPPLETQQSAQSVVQQANIKKLAPKKSTAVFKDTVNNQPVRPKADSDDVLPSVAPLPPVHRQLPSIQHSQFEPLLEKQLLPEEPLSVVLEEPKPAHRIEEPLGVVPSSEEAAPLRSDGIYIDHNGEVQQYIFEDDDEATEDRREPPSEETTIPTETANTQAVDELSPVLVTQQDQIGSEVAVPQKLASVSEPEEYWDEEEGNYEEEGYVTARSFKSRGENTTNGVTTVLFPKVNQKIKRELAAAKELIESTKTAEEIDDETWDTSMVAEYGDEIFGYMRDLEIKMLPNAHYMDNQAEIQWSMRSVLMGWLVQVHHRFGLLPETLFLCVNYIDRFLSCKIVSLGKLQLVGATAIFVAAKYEEINCPSVQEIVYMVDGGYTVDEILKAERFMLSMLQFELGWPGPMSFLRRISKADDYDLETRTLAKYFLELTIMDERFVGSPPSFVAAGAHCLARMMLKKGDWVSNGIVFASDGRAKCQQSAAHTYYSEYTYTQLYNLVLLMVECCEDPRNHHAAIFDKYMDKRYKRASLYAETEMRRGFQILDVNSNCAASWPMPSEDSQLWRLK
ncbi:MAG: hypothetical protein Q9224_001692 [Gallowayella concinna]